MCTGRWAKCTGDLLFPLALCCIVANILLFFPNGEVWGKEQLTESVWYFPGVIGGGVLVLLPASVMRAAGMKGSCFANRCGMMVSMLLSAVGVAGALYCMIVSAVGLQDGPLLQLIESYLFNQDVWDMCEHPKNVVLWNIVLFSILLGVGTLETVLLLSQVANGLLGCLCGTCMNNRQIKTMNVGPYL
uniref:Uncharacterized protein n=1 Tax=Pygocentrus nattereri TaxID=42514 RepID=A0AAR2KIQ3_PYGNA